MLGISSMYITLFENTVQSFIDDLRLHIGDITTAEIVDYKTTKLDSKPTIDALNKVREVKFTVHGPFEPSSNISNPDVEHRKVAMAKLKLSIDQAVNINAVGFVQHPGSKVFTYDKHAKELNDESLLELIDYASSRGIRMGIENMPPNVGFLSTPEEFEDFIKHNNAKVSIVFDVGHANMGGNMNEFVRKYASKFMQIHVTDNDGRSDGHLNVGEGTVNWEKFIADLKKYEFNGSYVVESVTDPYKSIKKLKELLK